MSEHKNRIASELLRASLSQFEADRQKAIATLDLYLYGAVGVGGHTEITEEVGAATKRLAEDEGAIACLQRNFFSPQESTTEEEVDNE